MKVLTFFWPFVKEVVFGDTTIKQAIKNHKLRFLGVGIIMMSLALNFFTIPRLVSITQDHLALVKAYRELEVKVKAMPTKAAAAAPPDPPSNPVPLVTPDKPALIKAPVKKAKLSRPALSRESDENYRDVLRSYEKMKQQENR